jgi:histidinol-phosphate aminotransferase
MNAILKLARPEIVAMTPYSSARSEKARGDIWLNANENPCNHEDLFNRYPEPQPLELIEKVANLYQTTSDSVLVTRGSDEAIDLIIRVFCAAGQDAIMITPPTYGMYKVSAVIQNAHIIQAPLIQEKDFALDYETILKNWHPNIKLIFLCSPNNPTGNLLEHYKVLELCKTLADKALIIVDEAYIEFAKATSLSSEIELHANLVILRTLSKAYGLAGVRCGTLIANPLIVQLLKQVLPPYPVPRPISQIVCQALSQEHVKQVQINRDEIIAQREWLTEQLGTLPFVVRVWPSAANFILLRVTDANKILTHCAAQGIILRNRSHDYGLENCIRITVGTSQENQLLIKVLNNV